MPWEELHLSWALPVPQFPFTLLLSGQHAGVDVAAPRSLQVQGGGNISGRKNSQENVFLCVSFCIRSLLDGSVLMCPMDSSDQEFWDEPCVAELSGALVLGMSEQP